MCTSTLLHEPTGTGTVKHVPLGTTTTAGASMLPLTHKFVAVPSGTSTVSRPGPLVRSTSSTSPCASVPVCDVVMRPTRLTASLMEIPPGTSTVRPRSMHEQHALVLDCADRSTPSTPSAANSV